MVYLIYSYDVFCFTCKISPYQLAAHLRHCMYFKLYIVRKILQFFDQISVAGKSLNYNYETEDLRYFVIEMFLVQNLVTNGYLLQIN